MKKLLLAVDGSEKSQKAAKKARTLAVAVKAEITLLTVITDIIHFGSSGFSPENFSPVQTQEIMEQNRKQAEAKAEKILSEVEKFLKEKNIKIKKEIKCGDSADNICEFADKGDFDMIILADKGEGGVKRFLLGSTSDKVVHHANTSVLIVK